MRLNGQKLGVQQNQIKNVQIRKKERKRGDEEGGGGNTGTPPPPMHMVCAEG